MDVVLASARSDQRFALEVLLREQPGVAVVGTTTGTEGLLALIETTGPDLVILDWDLPGRLPADVLVAARSLDCPPYMIILDSDRASQPVALSAGADAFVLRGDSPTVLLDAVDQARSQIGTAVERQTAPKDPIPTEAKGE